jgi:hypothetical protein
MTTNFDITGHVAYLASPALKGRVPLSPGSKAAREYIVGAFRKCGLKPLFDGRSSYMQEIDVGGEIHGTNAGGIAEGRKPGYVLVGAHYDHFAHSPGADDNAAAVAQVLAVAEHLSQHSPLDGRSILFLAFDCEEPPHFHGDSMGSTFFAEHCPVPLDEIQVAIVLDLTGHRVPKPGLEDCVFATGTEYAAAAYDAVTEAAAASRGIRVFCTSNDRVGDMSDHHAFRVNHRPFIFLSCGRTKHYHQPTDTVENLDLPKAAAIASFLARLVAACADGREFDPDKGDEDDGYRREFGNDGDDDTGRSDFKEKEAAGLSRLLGRRVSVAEAEGIIQALSRGL